MITLFEVTIFFCHWKAHDTMVCVSHLPFGSCGMWVASTSKLIISFPHAFWWLWISSTSLQGLTINETQIMALPQSTSWKATCLYGTLNGQHVYFIPLGIVIFILYSLFFLLPSVFLSFYGFWSFQKVLAAWLILLFSYLYILFGAYYVLLVWGSNRWNGGTSHFSPVYF